VKLAFTVYGKPEPQGSTRAFVPKGWKRPIITSSNKNLKPWRQQVTQAAIEAAAGEIIQRPESVRVRFDFYLARPATLPKRVREPTKKPDWDKLARAACDSLTGVVFEDDSQITQAVVCKHYGQPERLEIFVSTESHEFRNDSRVKETMELFV
jgi:Holliday junction resolvase RusA-like endonuclease